jgi:predicted transcriptional regulator
MRTGQTSVTLNEWQIREINQALAEADCGEFASDDEEVNRVLTKWQKAAPASDEKD